MAGFSRATTEFLAKASEAMIEVRMKCLQNNVLAQITGLPKLSIPEVKKLWCDLYGNEPQHASKSYLIKQISYRLQDCRQKKAPVGRFSKAITEALMSTSEPASAGRI
jgi:hypothetical protein